MPPRTIEQYAGNMAIDSTHRPHYEPPINFGSIIKRGYAMAEVHMVVSSGKKRRTFAFQTTSDGSMRLLFRSGTAYAVITVPNVLWPAFHEEYCAWREAKGHYDSLDKKDQRKSNHQTAIETDSILREMREEDGNG